MSDWVHCNKCSIKYGSQTTFFLVECGHIFCQRCVDKIKTTNKCFICNKVGNVLALNKDVKQNVLDFFLPVETFLKKTLEVYKFQLQHRNTLHQNLLDKYNYAKKEYLQCYNTNKHLLKENEMLRSLLRSAGKYPQKFLTSTPMSNSPNNLTFQNTSMVSSIPPHMGITPVSDKSAIKMYPGFPKRNTFLNSISSHDPSPVQRVPLGLEKFQEPPPMLHRSSMRSLEELRRNGGKNQ